MSSEEKKELSILWRIENFNFLTQKFEERFESPVFNAKIFDDTSWFIRLYPRGLGRSLIGGCLHRSAEDDGPSEISCDYEIQILSAEKNVLSSIKSCGKFKKNDSYGWAEVVERTLATLNDFLILRCTLKTDTQRIPLRTEISCVTNIGIDRSCFKGIVRNLNSSCSEIIKSPNTWKPQVEITILALEDIKITIRIVDNVSRSLTLMCQITLLDIKGSKQDSRKDFHLFSDPLDTWEFPSFLNKKKINSEKEKYLRNDCFELQFEIAVSNGTQSQVITDKTYDSPAKDLSCHDTGTVTILEDMKRLYKDKIHSDVKLLVSDQIIHAHKNILSIRSPVFMAMFGTEMVENETGSVTIPDLDTKTINLLLEYIYTGTVEHLDYESTIKLIVASEKYEVLSLKEKCANFLQPLLSDVNVCDVVVVADLIQHEVLKDEALKYIKNNLERIFISEKWNRFVEKNALLASEIVRKVSILVTADKK